MNKRTWLTTMLVIGSMWAVTACSGSPLEPMSRAELEAEEARRQLLNQPIVDPSPNMPTSSDLYR